MVPFKCDVHGWMNAYVGVLDHPYFAVTERGRQVRAEDAAARHLHDRSVAREARRADPERDDRREGNEGRHVHVQGRRAASQRELKCRAAGRSARRTSSLPSASLPQPSCSADAPPVRQVRRRLHRPPDPGRQPRHQHRLRPVRARLADDLRLEHVHVPAVEVGRRHLLRARAPADRQHRRLPHDHPGRLAVARATRGAG